MPGFAVLKKQRPSGRQTASPQQQRATPWAGSPQAAPELIEETVPAS